MITSIEVTRMFSGKCKDAPDHWVARVSYRYLIDNDFWLRGRTYATENLISHIAIDAAYQETLRGRAW